MGVGEDLLEDVLGVLAALQHRLAEAEQAAVVAGEQRLEGAVVAGADQLDEALVGLEAQQRRAAGEKPARGGACECGSFQDETSSLNNTVEAESCANLNFPPGRVNPVSTRSDSLHDPLPGWRNWNTRPA